MSAPSLLGSARSGLWSILFWVVVCLGGSCSCRVFSGLMRCGLHCASDPVLGPRLRASFCRPRRSALCAITAWVLTLFWGLVPICVFGAHS